MKELNELERSAKWNVDNFEPVTVAGTKEILAIAEAFRALEQENILLKQGCENNPLVHEVADWKERAEAAEAKFKKLQAALNQAEWVISGEQQNVRVLQGRESALNAEILALRELLPEGNQEPAAWMVGGWAYHDKRSAERRSQYDNLLMEPLYLRPAPAISLAELVPPEADGSNLPLAAYGWNACRADMLRKIEEIGRASCRERV